MRRRRLVLELVLELELDLELDIELGIDIYIYIYQKHVYFSDISYGYVFSK